MQVIERAGSPVVNQHPYAAPELPQALRVRPPQDAFHPPGAGGAYVRSSVLQGGVGMGVGSNAPVPQVENVCSPVSPHPYATHLTPGAQSRPESSVNVQGPTVEQQVIRHQQMNGELEPERKKGGLAKFLDMVLCRGV